MNGTMYERLLDSDVIPWILKTYPKVDFVFQQDRTLANNASSIQHKQTEELGGEAHCRLNEILPPQSPDLNPLTKASKAFCRMRSRECPIPIWRP